MTYRQRREGESEPDLESDKGDTASDGHRMPVDKVNNNTKLATRQQQQKKPLMKKFGGLLKKKRQH
jgi:hypothetical protein